MLGSRLLAELEAPGASGRDVILDLRGVVVLSAFGARLLAEQAERLAAGGRRLLLVAGRGAMWRALDFARRTRSGAVLETFTTVDRAMASLRSGAPTDTATGIDASTDPSTQLAEVLGMVARRLEAEPDLDGTIHAIVAAASTHIPGVEYAGISLVEHGVMCTVAPTAELVNALDEAQYRLREGPCVDAIGDHRTYRTGDLAGESRWPVFGPAAADHGVRSMLSYRLFTSEATMGALNLYSTQVDAFSVQTEQEGQVFATHAAIALSGAQKQEQFTEAIETRDTIAMAKGILMERHHIEPPGRVPDAGRNVSAHEHEALQGRGMAGRTSLG